LAFFEMMPQSMPKPDDIVALDIGGANLKATNGRDWTVAIPFPLWKQWKELPATLAEIVRGKLPRQLVATMTGEICDCYASRQAGVTHIVEALVAASDAIACPEPPGIYLVDGRIVPPNEAIAAWHLAAASNWHAVARLAGHIAPNARVFLIDTGSTTTDIIPIAGGAPVPIALDDPGRMMSGELVYTGLERTALAAIVRRLPHRDGWRPVASELFAESRDAWLTLGIIPESESANETADGAPATRAAARARLARMMLLAPEGFTDADAAVASEWIASRQATQIARAARRVANRVGWIPEAIVVSGHADELVCRSLRATGWNPRRIAIADWIGTDGARVAPAWAVALLATGEIP
jgi:probable H4MPT-linked C1 transfer pathway protein